MDMAGHWLVCGSDDGNVLVADLDAVISNPLKAQLQKYKHSGGMSFLDDKYRGITEIHCMPCEAFGSSGKGDSTTGQLVFSGCSKGIIKAWVLHDKYNAAAVDPALSYGLVSNQLTPPMGGGGGSNPAASTSWSVTMKLRMKQALTVVKAHSSPITSLLSKPFSYPAADEGGVGEMGWLLYSGDSSGGVAITRGSETSSNSMSSAANIFPQNNDSDTVIGGITTLALIGGNSASTHHIQSNQHSPFAASGITGSIWKNMRGNTNNRLSQYQDILVVGTSSGIVSALDVSTATPVFHSHGHRDKVVQVVGLKSNEFLSCSLDRTIKLWDIRVKSRSSGKALGGSSSIPQYGCRNLGSPSHRKCAASPVTSIAIGGWDNSLVISTSADGFVRIWDLRFNFNVPCRILKGHTNRITSLCWDGRNDFHSASHDGTVRSWDSISGQCTNVIHAFANDSDCQFSMPESEGITHLAMSQFRGGGFSSSTSEYGNNYSPDRRSAPPSLKHCVVARSWSGALKTFVHEM